MDSSQDRPPCNALIKMANQIAANIAPGKNEQQATRATADHFVRFWARSMKQQIIDCLDTSPKQLDPIAEQAVKLLQESYKQSKKKL